MEFRILGPLEVVTADGPIRIMGARQQKLLALLLLNADRLVTYDRIIYELWDSPPKSARQQVYNAIAALRRSIGDSTTIVSSDLGYRLSVPHELVDVHGFTESVSEAAHAAKSAELPAAIAQLRSALAVWRGPALEGLTGAEIESAATALDEQRSAALEELMALRLRVGEASAVIGELQSLVTEHPLRERLRISLMRALHVSGRQADALAVYEQCRRLLTDELGLDPGPELRQAHADVLNGKLFATSGGAAVSTPDPVRPGPVTSLSSGLLPRGTSDFSGRSAELTTLLHHARTSPPAALTIATIDGMGGVGKTALATHLAHEVAGDYPDGHYFVDLLGFTDGADTVTTSEALAVLLRASGMAPGLVPPALDERIAAWRTRVRGKRVLVILDNALDAAHVRPLLPDSAGSLVLITSRRKLSALEGALTVSLGVLPAEDGVSLFNNIAGEARTSGEQVAVSSAVELCGHLPLAIRIAAARLRDRSNWRVADLVHRLSDHRRRSRFLRVDDRCVMTTLKGSYRHLRVQDQRIFRLLSLHPGESFDVQVAAALTGLPAVEIEDSLDRLFDSNLLEQEVARRFHFHVLILDCARELLSEHGCEDEQRQAVNRFLDHYLHLAPSPEGPVRRTVVPQQFDTRMIPLATEGSLARS